MPRGRSPVLLLGAGSGEATCGILYLASYLRRHGIEAFVRIFDGDETQAEVRRSLEALLAHVRPKLVGLSLKWFHHVHRAQVLAKTIKRIDPEVEIVLGGNTASYFRAELSRWTCVDHLALGDGEVPLLALARGDEAPPNVLSRGPDGTMADRSFGYVQSPAAADVYYSHFDELFLSQLDRSCFSGWVQPGKGCSENCVYCGGTRGMQKATFGRAKPFLRPEESVLKDHQAIAAHTWQLRYDFAGSSAAFLERAWAGVDLSKHSTTYFLWGVPPKDLVETLSRTFAQVFMVLDIGCFAQSQRADLMRRGLLKPCPTDAELMDVIAHCRKFKNLELEISGIAGLPYASLATLAEERALMERLISMDCTLGYQRLESQPGALVTEHPARFEMVSEATSFQQFLDFFSRRELSGDGTVPMLRFADPKLERAVQTATLELEERAREQRATRGLPRLTGKTKLVDTSAARREVPLGEWLGRYRVPAKVAGEKVTVIRSVIGTGLSCAPSLDPRKFTDPALEQGESAEALLTVLGAFAKPTTVDAAVSRLRMDPEASLEVIDHLTFGRFLQPG